MLYSPPTNMAQELFGSEKKFRLKHMHPRNQRAGYLKITKKLQRR